MSGKKIHEPKAWEKAYLKEVTKLYLKIYDYANCPNAAHWMACNIKELKEKITPDTIRVWRRNPEMCEFVAWMNWVCQGPAIFNIKFG